MDSLYVDIETIPAQREDVRAFFAEKIGAETQAKLADVKAPSNYKDPDKIAEYIRNATDALLTGEEAAIDGEVAKTSFDGSFGQIVCICWAWNDGPIEAAYATDLLIDSERRVLREFFSAVHAGPTRLRIVGHNVAAFDLSFLRQRAIINGIMPPIAIPFDAKPWDEAIFDTMLKWGGMKPGGSMDKLCLALGIPGKGGISGADVWPMAQAGKFAEIAEYCKGDVERTRAIHKRMTYQVDA